METTFFDLMANRAVYRERSNAIPAYIFYLLVNFLSKFNIRGLILFMCENNNILAVITLTELDQTFANCALNMVIQAYNVDTDKNARHSSGSYVLSSILLSICFLESYINSLYSGNFHEPELKLKNVINYNFIKKLSEDFDIESKPILKKYELLLKYGADKKFEKGNKIYQNVYKLIKFRNIITHFKSYNNFYSVNKPRNDEIENLLKNCFYIENNSTEWEYSYLKYPCACWAINSVIDFIEDFHKQLNPEISFPYRHLIDKVREITKNMKWQDKYTKPSSKLAYCPLKNS